MFYTAPTAIRSLIKAADTTRMSRRASTTCHRSCLLGSVGEPINPEAWMWYYKTSAASAARSWILLADRDGGHMITPLPGVTPLVPGSCTQALPGIAAAIVDETANDVPNGSGGILVVKKPWPSMIRTIWGDPERFKKSYFPDELKGYYLAGDGAVRDAVHGNFRITGRIDDVLNVSGHRLGTMEIESALVANPLVAEGCGGWSSRRTDRRSRVGLRRAQGRRPADKESAARSRKSCVTGWQEIGPIAKPKDIRFGDNLPKTRSGKIMRRLLRAIAKGREITQDVSTLENPAILEQLKQNL